ncbi:MAG: hypothetical protein ACXVJ7_03740 [Acidimicrobiia bacterium]
MPAYETMFIELVLALEEEENLGLVRDLLEGDASLSQVIDELGLVHHSGQAAFIESTPASLQAAILAIVRENLSRDEPKQMMFSWAPGYDWELHLWESTASVVSDGGITVQVRSRYPGDAHPGVGS